MASTMIRVAGRPFEVTVYSLRNRSGYRCRFHEKREWLGRTWGYRPTNKNSKRLERSEIIGWFKDMVENNTPADESDAQVLEEVVSALDEEFEEVGTKPL